MVVKQGPEPLISGDAIEILDDPIAGAILRMEVEHRLAAALGTRKELRADACRRVLKTMRDVAPDETVTPEALAVWTRTWLLTRHSAFSLQRTGLWVTTADSEPVLAEG